MTRRSRRRVRKPRVHEEVELNMAAMLDMAFQLLAFFILTFQPSEIEAEISLRMPLDKPITKIASAAQDPEPELPSDEFSFPLPISLYAAGSGEIGRVVLGGREIVGNSPDEVYAEFAKQLASVLSVPGFDGIELKVERRLRYDALIRIVDMSTKQKLPNGEPLTKLTITQIE